MLYSKELFESPDGVAQRVGKDSSPHFSRRLFEIVSKESHSVGLFPQRPGTVSLRKTCLSHEDGEQRREVFYSNARSRGEELHMEMEQRNSPRHSIKLTRVVRYMDVSVDYAVPGAERAPTRARKAGMPHLCAGCGRQGRSC